MNRETTGALKKSQKNRTSKRIPISMAKPGMEISKDVFSRNDQVILNEGTVLDASMIAKIMFYSVDSLFVYESPEDEELSYSEQLLQSEDYMQFKQSFDAALNKIQNSVDVIAEGNSEVEEDFLFSEVEKVVCSTSSNKYVFDMLFCMRSYNEETYVHSLDVAVICNCFAKWLGLSDEDRRVITLGGLLHDIGKIKIPREILGKPGGLSAAEYEIIKTHSRIGYDILKDKKIDERIKLVALQHHERYDRSGYPNGLSGEELEPFAMITAIADVYDAMTSDRAYRKGICPFDVLKLLESDGRAQYDPRYLIPLLEQLSEVFIHHTVKLSDDSVGNIIMINKSELSKPVVQIGTDIVDLSRERSIHITEVI